MPSRHTLSFIDTSGEKATFSVEGVTLNATNFDAQNAAMAALRDAVEGISNLNIWKEERLASQTRDTLTRPADPTAQREKKWLVLYEDTVTHRVYSVEVPGQAAGHLLPDPSGGYMDIADVSTTEMAAFVAAFEAYVRSPVAANPIAILEIRAVHRNL